MIKSLAVNRAIDYILENISENLSVDEVADYVCLSKYYFCHLFKEVTGESVYSFIKRIKIELSAIHLKTEKTRTITDVGNDFGYSSSNYSTLFRSHFNFSPAEFRKNALQMSTKHPFFTLPQKRLDSFEECCSKITVKQLYPIRVVYERHIDNYYEMGKAWASFTKKYSNIINEDSLLIESTYNDPSITKSNVCIYDICATVPDNYKAENIMTLEGGKYAIYHYQGNTSGIYCAYQSIFCVWLVKTKNFLDDRRSFDIYRSIDCNTMELDIDICIPIK